MRSQSHPALVLVHGFRGAPTGLTEIKSALTDLGYSDLYVPAIPPFAGAAKLTDYTPDSYADFLKTYCESQHLQSPILIGHSMGSIIVAATLQKYPDSFHQKSVLLSPISVRTATPFRLIAPLSGLLPNRLIDYVTTKYLIINRNPETFRHALDLTHQCGVTPPTKRELLKAARFSTKYSVADFPSRHDFLFLAGERDRLIPQQCTIALAQKFHAQTHFLKGTGHIHNYEQPQPTAQAIYDFLSEV